MSELVRVLRIYEFVGDRKAVEAQVARSVHGRRVWRDTEGQRMAVVGATLTEFPEALSNAESIRAHDWWEDEGDRIAKIKAEAIKTAIVFLESMPAGPDVPQEEFVAALQAQQVAKLLKARFDIK